MKNIVILMYDYFPNESANTTCMKPIIDNLKKNCNVHIITSKRDKKESSYEVIDGINIYRTKDLVGKNNKTIFTFPKNNKTYTLKYLFARITNGILYRLKNNIFKNMNLDWSINSTYKKIIEINKRDKIDIIISESAPFVSHIISNKVKKKLGDSIKWYAIMFDPYTYNRANPTQTLHRRLEQEKRILKDAERIILFKENYNENIQNGLNVFKDKYYIIDYPNIDEKLKSVNDNSINPQNKKIKFVFAGMIYDNIREPQKTLEFFYQLMKRKNIDFEFVFCYKYSGKLNEVIKEYSNKMRDYLKIHQSMPKTFCDKEIETSNIIVNIGNSINNQTPSKVFENISTGKPIVSFYNIPDDTSKPYIEQYKLGFNVMQKEVYSEEDFKLFEEFIEKNKYKKITFEEATQGLKKSYEVADDVRKLILGGK